MVVVKTQGLPVFEILNPLKAICSKEPLALPPQLAGQVLFIYQRICEIDGEVLFLSSGFLCGRTLPIVESYSQTFGFVLIPVVMHMGWILVVFCIILVSC